MKKQFPAIIAALALWMGLVVPAFAAGAAPCFPDVPAGEWYAEAVDWAVEHEITNGTSPDTFSPNQNCTNAQIITFLWRAAGKPTSSAVCPAAVAEAYVEAVNWAYGMGLIDDNFEPDASCTRSSAVTYIWKAMDRPSAGASGFADVDAGAPYAAAVNWAVENGVTDGTGPDSFSPDQVCSRGHIVTFLHRAYK